MIGDHAASERLRDLLSMFEPELLADRTGGLLLDFTITVLI
jgi:hypothetical protein